MGDFELSDELRDAQRAAWHTYLDRVEPFRRLLHGYCLRLTGQLFDAEDLAQEALLRGFHRLSYMHDPIENPRAYLLRIATHTWIDALRRRETRSNAVLPEAPTATEPLATAGEARDAGRTLLQRLAPREQAALVLKDLFDMSLEDTAVVLETSVGAVKSALHRGRERLREPEGGPASQRPAPSDAVVDRFVALYNAEDRDGIIDLILPNASVSNLGVGDQYGTRSLTGKHSWVDGAIGRHPEWPKAFHFEAQRAERFALLGEPVMLVFRTRAGEEAMEMVIRLEEEDGRISRLTCYAFCPETIRAVGETLGVKVRTGLYRYPTPQPGVAYGSASM